MEMNEFINNFGNQFDDTDVSSLTPDTRFRELEEWSSLNALAIMNMIAKKYGVKLTNEAMKSTQTIQELYDLVASSK